MILRKFLEETWKPFTDKQYLSLAKSDIESFLFSGSFSVSVFYINILHIELGINIVRKIYNLIKIYNLALNKKGKSSVIKNEKQFIDYCAHLAVKSKGEEKMEIIWAKLFNVRSNVEVQNETDSL